MVIYILSAALLHWEAFLGPGVSGRMRTFLFLKRKKKKGVEGVFDTIMGVSNASGPLGGAIENIMSYQPTYHLFVFLRFFVFFLKLFTLDGHHPCRMIYSE